MQYIVEYALNEFTFIKGIDAIEFAEMMAVHAKESSPWTVTMKIRADVEDRIADTDEIGYFIERREAEND